MAQFGCLPRSHSMPATAATHCTVMIAKTQSGHAPIGAVLTVGLQSLRRCLLPFPLAAAAASIVKLALLSHARLLSNCDQVSGARIAPHTSCRQACAMRGLNTHVVEDSRHQITSCLVRSIRAQSRRTTRRCQPCPSQRSWSGTMRQPMAWAHASARRR